MAGSDSDFMMRLEIFFQRLSTLFRADRNESMLAVKAVDWGDDRYLSKEALTKICDLCAQFQEDHPHRFLMEDDVSLRQWLGICNRQANEIYLLYEESAPGDGPSECGFAITDLGICVKEFEEKWARLLPYDALLGRTIYATLHYKVSADDILLAEYMCIDSLFIVPRLVDLFTDIQGIVEQDYGGCRREDSTKIVSFPEERRAQKRGCHPELRKALSHAKSKLCSWEFDFFDNDDFDDEDDDDFYDDDDE